MKHFDENSLLSLCFFVEGLTLTCVWPGISTTFTLYLKKIIQQKVFRHAEAAAACMNILYEESEGKSCSSERWHFFLTDLGFAGSLLKLRSHKQNRKIGKLLLRSSCYPFRSKGGKGVEKFSFRPFLAKKLKVFCKNSLQSDRKLFFFGIAMYFHPTCKSQEERPMTSFCNR